MTQEEQDKLWAELPERGKVELLAKYSELAVKDDPQSKGYCQGMANVFGSHNLPQSLTSEGIHKA